MRLEPLPSTAAWRHHTARDGSEASFFAGADGWTTLEGGTAAVEADQPWIVGYRIVVDDRWRTRRAEITSRSPAGQSRVRLESDGEGNWQVDGVPDESLAGCLDVDLEASALTNTLPVHRFLLGSPAGEADPNPDVKPTAAPAVFVRARDCSVERLEQTYRRLGDGPDGPRFDYAAPVFDVRGVLSYDRAGLVIDYPGLARRIPMGS